MRTQTIRIKSTGVYSRKHGKFTLNFRLINHKPCLLEVCGSKNASGSKFIQQSNVMFLVKTQDILNRATNRRVTMETDAKKKRAMLFLSSSFVQWSFTFTS